MTPTKQETSNEPQWWEWAETHAAELVDYIKKLADPDVPNPPGPPPTPSPGPPAPSPPLPPSSGQIAWMCQDPSVPFTDTPANGGGWSDWVEGLNLGFPDLQKRWPHVEQWVNTAVAPGSTPPPGALSAVIRTTQAGDPVGALAWHDVDGAGNPFIIVLSDTCRKAGVSISSAMDHEFVELSVDPQCTAVADAPQSSPYPGVWALEVADPCEADSFNVTTSTGVEVQLSDRVGDQFFDMGQDGYDEGNFITAPFTLAPGGYAVVNGQDVFASKKKKGQEDRPPLGPIPARKRQATVDRANEILAALAAGFPGEDGEVSTAATEDTSGDDEATPPS